MQLDELLQQIREIEEQIKPEEDIVLNQLVNKALAKQGIEPAAKLELDYKQLEAICNHFYEMGFEDGVNNAEEEE